MAGNSCNERFLHEYLTLSLLCCRMYRYKCSEKKGPRPMNGKDKTHRILFDGRWIRPGSPDGITRYSKELIKALVKKDVSVTLIVHNPAQAEGLEINRIADFPHQNSLIASKRALKNLLESEDFDLYFCPHFLQILSKTRATTVLTCHDLTPWQYPAKNSSRIWAGFHKSYLGLRYLLKRASYVVTVSESTKKDLLAILPRANIKVIYNGVSPEFYDVKVKLCKKQLLYVGRYESYKNVELAIMALKGLPDYSLVCIGAISEERKSELASDRVEFVGPIDDVLYRKFLSESHALVMPSRSEGFGLPIVEAMAAGLPVVCSDIPVFREIGGESLSYVDVDNIDGYVEAISALEDTALRRRMVDSAKRQSEKFQWAKSAEAVLKLCTIDK